MARFVPLMAAMLIGGLAILAMITAGIMIQTQNGVSPSNSIGNDSAISAYYNSLNGTLINSSSDTTTSQAALTNSTTSTTGTIPYLNALGGIWKVLEAAPFTVFNLTANFISAELMGNNQAAANIITGVIFAILTLMLISAIVLWVMWGQGG